VEKKRKDTVKATHLRKRLRKEDHEKENMRREREGLSPETMPEFTPEESSLSGRVDFSESEDFEMDTTGSPLPVQQRRRRARRGPRRGWTGGRPRRWWAGDRPR
jgi:hypothetical protein